SPAAFRACRSRIPCPLLGRSPVTCSASRIVPFSARGDQVVAEQHPEQNQHADGHSHQVQHEISGSSVLTTSIHVLFLLACRDGDLDAKHLVCQRRGRAKGL